MKIRSRNKPKKITENVEYVVSGYDHNGKIIEDTYHISKITLRTKYSSKEYFYKRAKKGYRSIKIIQTTGWDMYK